MKSSRLLLKRIGAILGSKRNAKSGALASHGFSTDTPGVAKPQLVPENLLIAFRLHGEPSIAGLVYHHYWPQVLGTAIKLLGDLAAAEDATSDILLKVLGRLRMETPRNLGGWLHEVTKNHCYEILRARKRGPIVTSLEGLHLLAGPRMDSEVLEQRIDATSKSVWSAIHSLPDEQRICIQMFYFEGLSYKEVADATGYSEMGVKSYLQNGKRRLVGMLLNAWSEHLSDGTY